MNVVVLDRKPIFDEVRRLIGRGFTSGEVSRIDLAIDRALAVPRESIGPRLGTLSEQFESGGRGAGTVSSGARDPGGVSYGIYQLASRTGTVAVFMKAEGAAWADDFGSASPGSFAFSRIWRMVAARDPQPFADAQHAFIERTHYRSAVAAVLKVTGLDLGSRHRAVRDAVWSVSVQHGGAATILNAAVAEVDATLLRSRADYDRALIVAIYAQRSAYVLRVAGRSGAAEARTLRAIAENRYPAELKAALAMLEENGGSV